MDILFSLFILGSILVEKVSFQNEYLIEAPLWISVYKGFQIIKDEKSKKIYLNYIKNIVQLLQNLFQNE